jgi:hypothetical protein
MFSQIRITLPLGQTLRSPENSRNLLIINALNWWRRGESEYSGALKIHKLLKKRVAQNAQNAEVAPNWNVEISPSWDFLLVKMKVGLVYRCFAADWRAVAK